MDNSPTFRAEFILINNELNFLGLFFLRQKYK